MIEYIFSSRLRRNLYLLNATASFFNPHIDLDAGRYYRHGVRSSRIGHRPRWYYNTDSRICRAMRTRVDRPATTLLDNTAAGARHL